MLVDSSPGSKLLTLNMVDGYFLLFCYWVARALFSELQFGNWLATLSPGNYHLPLDRHGEGVVWNIYWCKSTIVWMMCRNVSKLHIHHHQLQTHATGLQRWGLKQHNFRFCFFCFQAIISGEIVAIFDEFRVSPYQKNPETSPKLAGARPMAAHPFLRLLGIACTNSAMEPIRVEGKEPTGRWRKWVDLASPKQRLAQIEK